MINGNIEQFLDTGWYSEATLFYRGYIYWCESNTNPATQQTHFWVSHWRAEMGKDMLYHSLVNAKNEYVEFEHVLDLYGTDMDKIKHDFLIAPIFEGKSFWEVESELAWLDAGSSIKVD